MRIKISLQRGPKYPKKGKNPWPKAKYQKTPKRGARNETEPPQPVATTARGGSHGLTVVSPTAVVEVASPDCAVFLRVPL